MITSRLLRSLTSAFLLLERAASAEPCKPDDEACVRDAESKFQTAREAMGRGDYATACPLLESSFALDPGNGTLLALALCHEGQNKLLTALEEYKRALEGAVGAGRADRVMLAESHVQTLTKRIPKLRIRFLPPEPVDAVVTLDDAVVPKTELASLPVDPGSHALVVSASSRRVFVTTAVATAGETTDVTIPSLAPELPKAPSKASNPARIVSVVTGAGAVLSLGAGAIFGALTLDAEARSKSQCAGTVCNQQGFDLNHEAKRDSIVADAFFLAGAVLGVTSIVSAVVSSRATISASSSGLKVHF